MLQGFGFVDGLGSSLPLLGIPLLFRHDRVPEQRLFSWPNRTLLLISFDGVRCELVRFVQ